MRRHRLLYEGTVREHLIASIAVPFHYNDKSLDSSTDSEIHTRYLNLNIQHGQHPLPRLLSPLHKLLALLALLVLLALLALLALLLTGVLGWNTWLLSPTNPSTTPCLLSSRSSLFS